MYSFAHSQSNWIARWPISTESKTRPIPLDRILACEDFADLSLLKPGLDLAIGG